MPSNSRSRPPAASQCPRKKRKQRQAHNVSKPAFAVIMHMMAERRHRLALPQKVQVYRACWVISILKEHSQNQLYFSSGEVTCTHLFNLLAQGSTVTLFRMCPSAMDCSRVPCNPPTVPYLPVTPTLRVRFVYKFLSYYEGVVHRSGRSPSWMSRIVEGDLAE